MDRARLFISLPIEPTLAKDIYRNFQIRNLPWEKIKVCHPDILHINLKFIGSLPVDKIPYIIELLDTVKGKQDFMEIEVDKALIINEKNPRVLTLGCRPNEILAKLHQDIDDILYENEIVSKDSRRFVPHITLGRIKSVATFAELQDFYNMPTNYTVSSTYFVLQESQLEKKGPTYYTLQTFNL